MKWRCPQCGKPHERNDPPCDNCGHHRFERAVVPQAVADEERERFVWACTACGRHHQRNNPPCSRCGNGTFEKRPLEYDDFEPDETSSYLELAGRFEVGAALVLVLLLAVGALGFVGVIDIPGLTPQGPPTIDGVPGNPEEADGISLAMVEAELLDSLDTQRVDSLDREDGLDSMATYLNQDRVKTYINGTESEVTRDDLQQFDTECRDEILFEYGVETPGPDATASTVASALASQVQSNSPSPTNAEVTRIGIDAHASPDGNVFVTVAYC